MAITFCRGMCTKFQIISRSSHSCSSRMSSLGTLHGRSSRHCSGRSPAWLAPRLPTSSGRWPSQQYHSTSRSLIRQFATAGTDDLQPGVHRKIRGDPCAACFRSLNNVNTSVCTYNIRQRTEGETLYLRPCKVHFPSVPFQEWHMTTNGMKTTG